MGPDFVGEVGVCFYVHGYLSVAFLCEGVCGRRGSLCFPDVVVVFAHVGFGRWMVGRCPWGLVGGIIATRGCHCTWLDVFGARGLRLDCAALFSGLADYSRPLTLVGVRFRQGRSPAFDHLCVGGWFPVRVLHGSQDLVSVCYIGVFQGFNSCQSQRLSSPYFLPIPRLCSGLT